MSRLRDVRRRRSSTVSRPAFTIDPPIGPEAEPAGSLVQNEQARLQAQVAAEAREAERRGTYDSLEIIDHVINPTVTVDLVSFKVPPGQVAVITGIGVTYSEPLQAMSVAVGWRITVDGGQVPNIRHGSEGLFYFSMSDISRPMEISSLYVQSGSTIAIQVVPDSGFNERLTVIGRLSGVLYQPSSRERN